MKHPDPDSPTNNINLPQTSVGLEELSALENFVRLQQSQTQYLEWLEANEQQAKLDGYIYRQIR